MIVNIAVLRDRIKDAIEGYLKEIDYKLGEDHQGDFDIIDAIRDEVDTITDEMETKVLWS